MTKPSPSALTRRQCLLGAVHAASGLAATTGPLLNARAAGAATEIAWPRLTLLDGSTLEPDSWQGQPAVLVFWATYCAFCKRHNAHLDKLFRMLPAASLRILGVALDGDAASVRRYMAGNDYRFPVALDPGGLRGLLTPRRVIPMTCLIDRRGRLQQAIPGEMAEDDVLALAQLARPAAAKAI
jgi:thiol-disulfide isomerase/thioredoxin